MWSKGAYHLANYTINSLILLLFMLVLAVFLSGRSVSMNSLTSTEYTSDVILPPGNFQIWPMTRIGALLIDLIILVIVLLLWFIPRRVYKTEHLTTDNSIQHFGMVSQFRMWGFWVCGVDSMTVRDGEVEINQRRGSGCCSIKSVKYPIEAVRLVTLKKRKIFSLGIVWAFLVGCLVGIWLHFIPCIWWTCDWGYFDGQGVRGGIWFATWGLVFFALTLFYPIVEMEVIIQPDPNDDQNLKKYMLAVGEGSARDIEDPVAAFDYKSIKQLLPPVAGNVDTTKETGHQSAENSKNAADNNPVLPPPSIADIP